MRALQLYEYRYRPEYERQASIPPEIRGQPRVGVMAQDLAATPVGARMVLREPNGMLGIDRDQATSAALGFAGRLTERADSLEARIRALEAARGGGRRG